MKLDASTTIVVLGLIFIQLSKITAPTVSGIIDQHTWTLQHCKPWPSNAFYLVSDKVFSCGGQLTSVKVCGRKDVWITARTWTLSDKGIITDTRSGEALITRKNKFQNLTTSLLFEPGNKFGFSVYDFSNTYRANPSCIIPFAMATSNKHRCSKPSIVFKVTKDCYRKTSTSQPIITTVQPSASSVSSTLPQPTANPSKKNDNRLCSQTGVVYYFSFIGTACLCGILFMILLVMTWCTVCMGVKRSRYRDKLDQTGQDTPTSGPRAAPHAGPQRRSKPAQPAPYGTYAVYRSAQQIQAKQGTGTYDTVRNQPIPSHYETAGQAPGGIYESVNYQPSFPVLERSTVELLGRLGSEMHCELYKGKVQNGEDGPVIATVKVVNTKNKEKGQNVVLKEAAILAMFDHTHVVKLLGVIDVGSPVMSVTEYLSTGPLKSYLGRLKTSVPEGYDLENLLLMFCHQVAEGMAYLASQTFVHRELCAKNIHLDQQLNCKITGIKDPDSDLDDLYTCTEGQVPIKWTAPEAILYGLFTAKSDVWSYGMVMYEIWSLGHKPFAKITADKIPETVDSGYVQHPPPGCPRAMYNLMIQCWNPKDTSRPSFQFIETKFTKVGSRLLDWSDMDKQDMPKKAAVLGGDINDSASLYADLQQTYTNI